MPQKILLVEDEAIIAMTTAKMIEKHGFEVVTAHPGTLPNENRRNMK